MTKEPTLTLEQKIAAALKAETVTSDDLELLIEETTAGIVGADEIAATEGEKALDPALSPDPRAARAAAEDATFAANRLRTLLPRLQQRHAEAEAREKAQAWEARYKTVKRERDALAKELAEMYPAGVARLADLFGRMAACDAECCDVNSAAAALDGEHRRLVGPELAARGLDAFSRSAPSIAKTVQLPDWDHSDHMAWPSPQPSMAASLAGSMVPAHDPAFSADWAAAQGRRRAEIEAEQRRLAGYYRKTTEEQEERQNREERERFAGRQPQFQSRGCSR